MVVAVAVTVDETPRRATRPSSPARVALRPSHQDGVRGATFA